MARYIIATLLFIVSGTIMFFASQESSPLTAAKIIIPAIFALIGLYFLFRTQSLRPHQAEAFTPDERLLHDAVQNGDVSIVASLLKKSVDPNSGLSGEPSNLMRAIDEKYCEIAQLLLDHGADVNYHDDLGDTPLGVAVQINSADFVKVLIHDGAHVNHKDSAGHTELYYAERDGKAEVAQILMKHGAKH